MSLWSWDATLLTHGALPTRKWLEVLQISLFKFL